MWPAQCSPSPAAVAKVSPDHPSTTLFLCSTLVIELRGPETPHALHFNGKNPECEGGHPEWGGLLPVWCVRRKGGRVGKREQERGESLPSGTGMWWQKHIWTLSDSDSHTNTHTHADTSSETLPSLLPTQPTASRSPRILLQIHTTPKT